MKEFLYAIWAMPKEAFARYLILIIGVMFMLDFGKPILIQIKKITNTNGKDED